MLHHKLAPGDLITGLVRANVLEAAAEFLILTG
jgi:hypothetical protein